MKSRLLRTMSLVVLLLTACNPGSYAFPLTFPPQPFSEQQIAEVRACDIPTLNQTRYPQAMAITQLKSAYQPVTPCDWAALALAYADRVKEDPAYDDFNTPLPDAAREAYSTAISSNPAFILADPLLYYFGRFNLVNPPAFAALPVTTLQIKYHWAGYGDTVSYTLLIEDADTAPAVGTDPESLVDEINLTIDPQLIQHIGAAARNLIPIPAKFSYQPCWDNFPAWEVLVKYQDGNQMLVTSSSNYAAWGGPWQVNINGRQYIQASFDLWEAVYNLTIALKLPYGEPAAYGCGGDLSLFEAIFGK